MAGSRGRGRGRGGRGNATAFQSGSTLMGGQSYQDVIDFSSQPMLSSLAAYPPMHYPQLREPTEREEKLVAIHEEQLEIMQQSRWYIRRPDANLKEGDAALDTYRALPSITDPETKAMLNPAFFPAELWDALYEKKPKARMPTQQKRAKLDLDAALAEDELGADEEEAAEEPQAVSDEDEDPDALEEPDDYDNNYFQTGEDDDDGGDDDGGYEGGIMD
ncbi:hypothetical protein E5Q_04078 [Mixia osmundae IAM 14324]|uniref:DNA-directed RNA polymerase III subunit n=1 Tax=Mixia osmundae (strain CBS 9802 / IAM 14324 / JCM 22182 / KY 12970) TaxID=764103 RepID=G7E3J0_MIXOS|nr:hypothetical protein E5Q_04078 [Mixia osmundae IAM 14324]